MGRPATGAPRWNASQGYWEARVSIGEDRRPVPMRGIPKCSIARSSPASCSCEACSQARRVAKLISDKARAEGHVPAESGETANEWYARYLQHHKSLGFKTVGYLNSWNQYAADLIGTRSMKSLTGADIKRVRDRLTQARIDGKIGAKRAMNVWSDQIATAFSRAFTDDDPKYSAVRVGPASANPAAGIKPPVNSTDIEEDERERQPLEPSQFLSLMTCEALSIEWRQQSALKAYTGLRPAEVYGLMWPDVRLDADRPVIRIQRTRDMKTGEIGSTKTKSSNRDVPIHPQLVPLLRSMRASAPDRHGYVIAIADEDVRESEKAPDVVRDALKTAGIRDRELLYGNDNLRPFDDRSWRTTFATWCAKAGYDSTWVDAWLGHKPKSTAAKHYVKDTPAFEDIPPRPTRVGVAPPFPPLPACMLVEASTRFGLGFGPKQNQPSNSVPLECERRDLKPRGVHPKSSDQLRRESPRSAENPNASVTPASTDRSPDQPTESAQKQPPEKEPSDLIREAIKRHLDRGEEDLASELMTLLSRRRPAPVVALAVVK